MLLEQLKVGLIAIALGLLIGFGSGWKVHSWKDGAQLTKQVTEARKSDAVEVARSEAASTALDARVTRIDTGAETLKQKAKTYAYLVPSQPFGATVLGPGLPGPVADRCAGDPRLSVGLVGVLNDARDGAFDHPAAVGDAPGTDPAQAGNAPSAVTVPEFVDNDIEVTKLFHKLAEDHDALVDYVEHLQADQRKRMGAD